MPRYEVPLSFNDLIQCQMIEADLRSRDQWLDAVALARIGTDHEKPEIRELATEKLLIMFNDSLDRLGLPKEEKPKYRWVNGARVKVV